jgi:DnaJ-class molecular chaperone
MSLNYYELLNVSCNSSASEIKSAYRQLTLKHHPNNSKSTAGSKKIFDQITEAYKTLSNNVLRQQYDTIILGFNQNQNQNSSNHQNQEQIVPYSPFEKKSPHSKKHMHDDDMSIASSIDIPHFNNFHNNMSSNQSQGNISGMMSATSLNSSCTKPPTIVSTLNIGMDIVMKGGILPIRIERWIIENGEKINETETLYITIPKGVDDHEIIIVPQKGNVTSDLIGDVKIFIKVDNHSIFVRSGLDLTMTYEITLKESLCGFTFQLDHLNGKQYTINNFDTITSPHKCKIINGLGIPRGDVVGDLYLSFSIIFPSSLSDEQKHTLSDLL